MKSKWWRDTVATLHWAGGSMNAQRPRPARSERDPKQQIGRAAQRIALAEISRSVVCRLLSVRSCVEDSMAEWREDSHVRRRSVVRYVSSSSEHPPVPTLPAHRSAMEGQQSAWRR